MPFGMRWTNERYVVRTDSVDSILDDFGRYSRDSIVRGELPPSSAEILGILLEASDRIPESQRAVHNALARELRTGKYDRFDPQAITELKYAALRNVLVQQGNA
jgi:hypothetical protein